ncbi:hypothetical protein QWA_10069 [Alcaligenes faecalis subsp. faecalis NCIB 8687]|nr:hypothetical protein QWA_10069 [Alcaligenes faecalis subsp. faecalis NCIB 8687]
MLLFSDAGGKVRLQAVYTMHPLALKAEALVHPNAVVTKGLAAPHPSGLPAVSWRPLECLTCAFLSVRT